MKLKNGLLSRKNKLHVFGLVLVTCLALTSFDTIMVKADEKIIRVGYDSNSNFIQEVDGNHYGYGVEYLEKISKYTGWKYEFVNDESWHASLDKLRNGEIDLICTAHYTEERAEEFLYSSIPLGYETSLLYAKADSPIYYQDFDAMDGCRVGLLEESYSAQDFIQYAEKVGIEYEGIYFEKENDMITALENDKIDMMVIGSRYGTSELKLVDRSGANAFYCITNTENEALIEEIEEVLQELMFDDPKFEGLLNEKYFSHKSVSNSPLYTKEELAFIECLGTVKVKFIQDQRPSCYMENGETKGIWAEVLKLLSEKSGIQFELEAALSDTYSIETYDEFLKNGYLLLRTQRAMEYANATTETISSNAITSVSLTYIKQQEAFVEDENTAYTIAMTRDLAYLEPILLEENPEYKVTYYNNTKSCLEAVLNQEADLAIQNSYRVSYLMQKPEYADKLAEVPGIDHGNEVCLVAPADQQMLIEVINKAIQYISNDEITEIVQKELLLNPYPMEYDDILYLYWEWMLGIFVVIVFGLVVYTAITQRMANMEIQKKEYELLQKKIQLDELTGLYNRTYFYEKAKEQIEDTDEEMCIVTMDISNFKVVNELYGMNVGDQLLKDVAEHVQELDTHHDMVLARFMADHYYLCMPKAEFDEITLPQSFKTFLEEMDIRVVYGVFFVEDKKEMPINVMCDRAFIAAHDKPYKYKEYIHFYDDDERKHVLQEQEIENDMEKALEEKQFYIVVQPKYNPQTGKIVGGETLVRWQHPVKGIISPGVFIKVFEKDGFIIQLDYFVWEETCRLIKQMKEKGIKTVPISINVSRAHFYGSELINKLQELIEKYGLETKDIELEITESICGDSSDNIYVMIKQLQEAGFKIAMDDFGSGYSSLNMLKDMPLDIIKMDLKFLDGEENKSRQILKALIELAETMELKVVVEGVEILSQVEFLKQFKECYVQGYYYSRPVVSEVFEEMLKDN